MSITKPFINKFLSLMLVLSVVLAGLLPSTAVYASEVNTPGSAKSNAVLNSDGLIMDVTVPTNVLIYVDEHGEVTTPDYLPIINNSVAPVFVHSLSVTPKNGWTLDPTNTDYTNFKVNQKNYWIAFNGLDPSNGTIALATPINGSDSLNLVLSADVAPQRTAVSGLNIGEIVITFDWDAAEGAQEGTGGGNQGIGKMPDHYVVAEDSDWEGEADGEFHYIGSNPYVAVPHEIKGIPVTSYEGMFKDTHVKGVYSDNPNITTTKAMFHGTAIEEVLLEISNVTDMSQMFAQVEVDELDLTKLNTSKVKNFQHMFWDAKVPKLDLSNFDTSSAEILSYMFMQTVTNELDLSSFDIPETANTDHMFGLTPVTKGYAKTQEDADRLNSTSGKPEYLIFTVKGAGDDNDSDYSDYDDPDFNPDDYPEGYEMSKNSDWVLLHVWQPMYIGNDDYPIIPETINGVELTGLNMAFGQGWHHPIKGVYVDNPNIETANSMFEDLDSPTLDLQYINLPNLRSAQDMFNNTKAETLDLSNWDVSNLHSAQRMFKDSAATNIVLSGLNFESLNQAEEMFAGVNVGTLTLKGLTFSANEMFKGATIDVLDLSEFKFQFPDGSIHTMDSIFKDVFKDATIGTLYVFDRDQAELINRSSNKPAGLKAVVKGQPELPEGYVLALDRDFSESNKFTYRKPEFLTSYYGFGKNTYGFEHDKFVLPSTIRGVEVTSYSGMMSDWYYEGDENKLPTHFKSSNPAITDMSSMFKSYPTATLNLDFNTSNVTTMVSMFSGTKATNLDLSGFNTDKVENMSSMFNGAEASVIDISSFRLADTQPDVSNMFKDAEATTVYVRSQADIDYIIANHDSDLPETLNFVIK